jgi:hypothetical protein
VWPLCAIVSAQGMPSLPNPIQPIFIESSLHCLLIAQKNEHVKIYMLNTIISVGSYTGTLSK